MSVLPNKWSRHFISGGRSRTRSRRRFELEPLESRVVLSVPASVVSPGTLYGATATMTLQDFNGPKVPVDKEGIAYPNEGGPYDPHYGGGTGTVSINTSDAITGNSLQISVTAGELYAQFNPYDGSGRGFARDYSADPAAWKFNTYNRMSFWIKVPTTGLPLGTDGQGNAQVGTFVKQITNSDYHSDETGGGHYYHGLNLPNNGQWTHVILNMHPDHRRGDPGSVDPGNLPYPTTATFGGADPASTYNYFDTLTRFYIETDAVAPGTYLIDDIRFYQETAPENDAKIYSLTGNYDPTRNEVIATWERLKTDNTINDEVRYAFSDIHQIGWDAATPAPNGVVAPSDYNGMVYVTTALPLAGHSVVYIAIKPQNSDLFSQIAIPLRRGGPPG